MIKKVLWSPFLMCSLAGAGQPGSCPSLSATGQRHCNSDTIRLSASPGFDQYSWTPAAGLSDPGISNPVAVSSSPASYTVTAMNGGVNLVVNPDFSAGNYGFVSGMNFSSIYAPGNYFVGPGWFGTGYLQNKDHTPTADNMYMSMDGSASMIWQESFTLLQPNQPYVFSFWASRVDNMQPILEVHFTGNVTGDHLLSTFNIPYSGTWAWDQYSVPPWNSGSNTSVTIRIVNLQSSAYGNDFGLDDLSFDLLPCVDTAVVNINTFSDSVESIITPNVFTPNHDAVNDLYYIPGAKSDARCIIYNRWGTMIKELRGEGAAWNGTTSGGEDCPDGNYFYILTATDNCGEKVSKQGFIQLIR